MYTGIRFKGYVKKQFRENFEPIAICGDWKSSEDIIFSDFGHLERSHMIPCGALCYMPSVWRRYDFYSDEWVDIDGFERTWDKETGYWTFQCSLKNYLYEIEQFISMIPYFIEKLEHLEYFYEEFDYSVEYRLEDNKIKCVNNKFKRY